MLNLLAIAGCAGCLAATSACAQQQHDTLTPATREEVEDYRNSLRSEAAAVQKYLHQTQAGKNVSELSLGWVAYDILVTVSTQDDGLYDYFNQGGRDLQTYLKTAFQRDPAHEIATLDAMVEQTCALSRRVARDTLEALRHIPDSGEAAEVQERDRKDLARALAALKDHLDQAADAVVLPPPENP